MNLRCLIWLLVLCPAICPISLIPNPSFEDMNCCPNDRSQLNCASDWIQASEPTTDYINTCGYMGWDDFPPPQPFPDGEGIIGFRDGRVRDSGPDPYWKEYTGACLLAPMLANTAYRFYFEIGFVNAWASPPINVSFFGTPDCDFLPFGVGDDEFGCPSNDVNWEKLADVYIDGLSGNVWIYTTLEATPDQDIYAIAIGPDCPPVDNPVSTYYFLDNLILADLGSFDLQISESSHLCDSNFTLSVPASETFDYQWYMDGIALVGEEEAELSQNYGEGVYQVRILDGISCRVSTYYEYEIPEALVSITRTICEDETFSLGTDVLGEAGTYTETLVTEEGCDSTVTLDLVIVGDAYDTISVSILQGESYIIDGQSFNQEGEYPLTLISSLGCDSLLLLKLSTFDISIPNAFSPNGDGVNDEFFPLYSSTDIRSYELYVYDRWGRLIYSGDKWNGINNLLGVYSYVVNVEFFHTDPKVFKGNVTLIR